ncbi:site-specific integrase [Streptomyces olivaceus]|uniref:tyrosine-type recombinase/integrase n=1 Tax=Streptomyces olivaceus TaxID=47716 RepID=UPI001CCD21D9|nr:tyrosine-type recombinase/integrase [Streptomyces olivaceus]MBZ6081540.1 site-specific integrase [Streptomyces olivaceus]
MASTQRVVLGEGVTWTVVGEDFRVAEPVEQYLEYLRSRDCSPNTLKSYARGLALWWTFLERRAQSWDAIGVTELGTFVGQLRRESVAEDVVPLDDGTGRAADATVASRARAVMGFYRYHAARGVEVAGRLYETVKARPGSYLPFLEHVARRTGRRSSVVKIRVRAKPVPVLLPGQMAAIREAEAAWDAAGAVWSGELRYRLLWTLLEETGLRLGEAIGLRHRDWKTGTGTTAQVEVVHREDHPHGVRAKSGHRRVFVGSALDRLYGDWVWALCEAGADVELGDWDDAYIFCNLRRGSRFAPIRPESVYKHLGVVKRRLPAVPHGMTPHWYRHTHATALLLAGVPMHVVSRRLGHADVQTTINTYAHVTEDAELRACADWQKITQAWGTGHES